MEKRTSGVLAQSAQPHCVSLKCLVSRGPAWNKVGEEAELIVESLLRSKAWCIYFRLNQVLGWIGILRIFRRPSLTSSRSSRDFLRLLHRGPGHCIVKPNSYESEVGILFERYVLNQIS